MSSLVQRIVIAPFSLALACCSASSPNAAPTPIPTRQNGQTRAAQALLGAKPEAWPTAARHLLESGGSVSQDLIAALEKNPTGPGLQIAVATLGKLGDARAIPTLERLLRERSAISSEAALALGRLPAPQSIELLKGEMLHRGGNPLNRTCAAVALLDLGDAKDSLPFLRAILLVGTSFGLSLRTEYGLPDGSRWAHERFLAIEAVGRHFHGETFGLDPDSPWPRLKAAADRLQAAARNER